MRATTHTLLLLTLVIAPRLASADKVDKQVEQLHKGMPYKVRLSAALYLAKQRNKRAVRALAVALSNDVESTVRRICALSLATLIDVDLDRRTQKAALAALDRASKKDQDRRVRENAQTSLHRLKPLIARLRGGKQSSAKVAETTTTTSQSSGSVFVHVPKPNDLSHQLPSGSVESVQAALRGSLKRHAPDYVQATSPPSKAELTSRQLRGFRIGAQVAKVAVESSGSLANVRCTVSVRVSPWSGSDGGERLVADESASATGNGMVSTRARDVKRAAAECAVAVTEELTARQVVPFLRRVASTN